MAGKQVQTSHPNRLLVSHCTVPMAYRGPICLASAQQEVPPQIRFHVLPQDLLRFTIEMSSTISEIDFQTTLDVSISKCQETWPKLRWAAHSRFWPHYPIRSAPKVPHLEHSVPRHQLERKTRSHIVTIHGTFIQLIQFIQFNCQVKHYMQICPKAVRKLVSDPRLIDQTAFVCHQNTATSRKGLEQIPSSWFKMTQIKPSNVLYLTWIDDNPKEKKSEQMHCCNFCSL